MDKYSMYGECSLCGNKYMKINPMVKCNDENGNIVRVCQSCYESKYKNKFGNIDNSEDQFYN